MAINRYQENLRDIIGGTMPEFKQQRKSQYDFLVQQALRTGQSAASAVTAVRPFAEAAGRGAAKAGVEAKRLAVQQEQFDVGQEAYERRFARAGEQWEKSFEQRTKEQEFANMMNLYQQNKIMTPEMLEAFGYGDISRGDVRGVQSQLDILGLGGGGGPRNPLRERAMQPGPGIGSNVAQRRQQAWLQSQFG